MEWLTEEWLLTVASLLEEGEGLTGELEHVSPVAHSSDVAALTDGANETSSPVDFDSCHAKGKQPPGACRGFGEPSKAYENYRGLLPTTSGGQRRGGRPNSGGFAVMGAARVCGQPGGSRDTVPRGAAEQPVRGSRDGHSQRGGAADNEQAGHAHEDTAMDTQLDNDAAVTQGLDPRVTQCPLKGVQDLQVPAMRPAQPLLSRLQPHRGSGTCDKRWRRYKFRPVLKGTRTRSQR